MSVERSAIQKIFNNTIYHGYLRLITESRTRYGKRQFEGWVRNVVSLQKPYDTTPDHGGNTEISVANRVVHLDGYATHEDVVRAYLEFAGIDPDSKEGRAYFEL